MPRNISFMLTTDQIRNKTKTVTRRLGWTFLKPGDILNACVKCQGLKKGEKIEKICQIRVIDVRRERLDNIFYNLADLEKEGFPEMEPEDFIDMFTREMRCDEDQEITRIEFEYIEPVNVCPVEFTMKCLEKHCGHESYAKKLERRLRKEAKLRYYGKKGQIEMFPPSEQGILEKFDENFEKMIQWYLRNIDDKKWFYTLRDMLEDGREYTLFDSFVRWQRDIWFWVDRLSQEK